MQIMLFQIICIFININENIRKERTNGENMQKKIMDVHTKLLIFQQPIALEYKTYPKISAKTLHFYPVV